MATMTKKNDLYQDIEKYFGKVPDWVRQIPDTAVEGFWLQMRDFYMADTKIPNKYKDLIGLAVAGATRCKYCALFHTEGAKLNGATDDEIAEASTMAALAMQGSTFLNAQQIDYESFRKETLDAIAYARAHMPSPTAAKGQPQPVTRGSH